MFNLLPSLFLIDIFKKKHKVYWSNETIAFNGIPFMILNQKVFDCQHGKDRNINKKNKSAESNDKKWQFLDSFLVFEQIHDRFTWKFVTIKTMQLWQKLNRERRWRRRKKKFIYLFESNFWGWVFAAGFKTGGIR